MDAMSVFYSHTSENDREKMMFEKQSFTSTWKRYFFNHNDIDGNKDEEDNGETMTQTATKPKAKKKKRRSSVV
jgi:hypothetical protein